MFAKMEIHHDHIYDSSVTTHHDPYLWSSHSNQPSSISMIHAYQATKLHVYDPWIPIHQNPCLWSMYIPTHQDTHIYDPVIPINRALYRWLMHTCQPAPYLYMIHAHQPTKIHIYNPSIFANQAPYLWFMQTNQLWKYSPPWPGNKSAAGSVFVMKQ